MVLETGAAVALFAATFLVGGRMHPLALFTADRRSAVSVGAGMSTAYVFVHVLPELQQARGTLAKATELRYEGIAVYFLAMVGFLCFYGLDHLRVRASKVDGYRLHLAGFAAYVSLVAYLLVRNLEQTSWSLAAYVVAMMCHFLAIDHALREEHGAAFDRTGRFVLSAACVLGWGAGVLFAVPPFVLALLLAFVSGAVIMNSAIMELPSEKAGRFWPFVVGGLAYAVLLLPLS
jgi:hypothetical protein